MEKKNRTILTSRFMEPPKKSTDQKWLHFSRSKKFPAPNRFLLFRFGFVLGIEQAARKYKRMSNFYITFSGWTMFSIRSNKLCRYIWMNAAGSKKLELTIENQHSHTIKKTQQMVKKTFSRSYRRLSWKLFISFHGYFFFMCK